VRIENLFVCLAAAGAAAGFGMEEALEVHGVDPWQSLCVYGLPAGLMPEEVDTVWVIADIESEPRKPSLWAVGIGESGPVDLGPVEFPGRYNPAKAWWSWSEELSAVTAHSQYPFCTYYDAASYSFTGGRPCLALDSSWSGDPSADALARLDSLLEAGRLEGARLELGEVFYPFHYYVPEEMNARFLLAAHSEALRRWPEGSAEEALEPYSIALKAFEWTNYDLQWFLEQGGASDLKAGGYGPYIGPGELAGAVNDYGFYLQQAGRPEEALEALAAVLLLEPDRAVAHLNTADALWDLGREEAAGRHYSRYLALLQEKGLDVEVPPRVNSRLRSVPDVN
jgi:hypothetical protein